MQLNLTILTFSIELYGPHA